METPLHLPVADGAAVRILQITDTHLFAGETDTLLGINTLHSYHAVLDAIVKQQLPADLIVATGDLVQDQSTRAYQRFTDGIARLPAPCVWLPGNHDYQPSMAQELTAAGISPSKQVLLGDQWQILLLDSQVQSVPHGELSDDQLIWLDNCLAQQPDRHTVVMLHHHPLASGCTWLDQHSLRNSHMLAEVLTRYQNIEGILCGHIHQDLDVMWNGIRMLATPSTCVQFKPHCTNFTLDTAAPGWRYLELTTGDNPSLTTQLFRLDTDEFSPDLGSDGY
ncbi:TPA: 3',5'-cyclic-AMP phosphodiesterase [Morganella morganii]|uniref:3',5'-cyclic-AMP phosphodiesterase n=1 Tax=Morganella morganii TaxID=582 RepID=UPI0005FBF931|nr:3',5'-cyclic-AMP phosphodiesterase [Morganella morganii]ELA7679656.1 3',5'-cyclic-AMP phosphodiesterase [Morganella morganii]KJY05112.1 3',5'-cyclic adenosine monophosphate phosphodiesterase CpdA [Morganella morganii]MBT0361477.1 3',5'-cyclic-AMP phosphodiesterase [Morganella morganii subsp. morganii]MDU2632432.1 3',5'-cyclic-AMP phosphodiesterase [Morganella morganii]STZ21008.1 3',5'-cyclic adenosine monophosphate phosphodiesterase CpdA [Morganella morganii]